MSDHTLSSQDGPTTTHQQSPSAVAADGSSLTRLILLVGTPVLLGLLFLIHPHGGGLDTLLPVAETWLVVHLAMLPLLGLWGISFYLLLEGFSGTVATIGRIGVAIYMTFYIPFEAIAGITTGLLAYEAQGLPSAQQEGVAVAIDALFVPGIALGILGTVGVLLAVVATGILMRRSGAPRVPVFLLGGAPLAAMFHSGARVDAIAITGFILGVLWLELRWRPTTDNQIQNTQQTGEGNYASE